MDSPLLFSAAGIQCCALHPYYVQSLVLCACVFQCPSIKIYRGKQAGYQLMHNLSAHLFEKPPACQFIHQSKHTFGHPLSHHLCSSVLSSHPLFCSLVHPPTHPPIYPPTHPAIHLPFIHAGVVLLMRN